MNSGTLPGKFSPRMSNQTKALSKQSSAYNRTLGTIKYSIWHRVRTFIHDLNFPIDYYGRRAYQSDVYYNWKYHAKENDFRDSQITSLSPANRFLLLIDIIFSLKGFLVILTKQCTKSRICVYTGGEVFQPAPRVMESLSLSWNFISMTFYPFYCQNQALKFFNFTAIIFQTKSELISKMGLSPVDSDYFVRIRKRYRALFQLSVNGCHLSTLTLIGFMSHLNGLYEEAFLFSVLWVCLFVCWAGPTFAGVHSTCTYFIVMAEYIHTKQSSLALGIESILDPYMQRAHHIFPSRFWLLQRVTIRYQKYLRLALELEDYERFWNPFLSIVMINFILLISYLMFAITFTDLIVPFKLFLISLLVVHLFLLLQLCRISNKVSNRNQSLKLAFQSFIVRFVTDKALKKLDRHKVSLH